MFRKSSLLIHKLIILLCFLSLQQKTLNKLGEMRFMSLSCLLYRQMNSAKKVFIF